MNGLDLSTPPRSLPGGNGRKLLTPGNRTTLSGFDVSFETGTNGAETHVEINRQRNGQVHVTVHVFVDGDRLAASIRNIHNAATGVVWIRVTKRGSLSHMEVIMGNQIPPVQNGHGTRARIKIIDTESNKNDSESDDEGMEDKDFQIFVKLFNGKSTTYYVNSGTSVKKLMLMIQERHQIPPNQQRLLYGGQQLEEQRSLGSYNIQRDATLNIVSRLRGG